MPRSRVNGMTAERAAFEAAWDRFASWLSAHCPIDHAALRPAATTEEIRTLEIRLGFPLHPQLRALLERHNGVMENPEPDNVYARGLSFRWDTGSVERTASPTSTSCW